MREGSLDAPTRHPIPWQEESFYDEADLDAELRRVFDICHGCRRCFNLCDSFPKLFDLIDESAHEDVEHLDSADFKPVTDACTLCDMCFMTKCPYVPPHEFNLDFPHLMLRARAIETACHVIAAAQAGTHADGRATFGHSLAVDPWGTVTAEADATNGAGDEGFDLVLAPIAPAAAGRARQAIPLARSRSIRNVTI